MADFKSGDKVRHKAGGPSLMVVLHAGIDSMTKEPYVACEWWEKGKRQQGSFSPDVLEHIVPAQMQGGQLISDDRLAGLLPPGS